MKDWWNRIIDSNVSSGIALFNFKDKAYQINKTFEKFLKKDKSSEMKKFDLMNSASGYIGANNL